MILKRALHPFKFYSTLLKLTITFTHLCQRHLLRVLKRKYIFSFRQRNDLSKNLRWFMKGLDLGPFQSSFHFLLPFYWNNIINTLLSHSMILVWMIWFRKNLNHKLVFSCRQECPIATKRSFVLFHSCILLQSVHFQLRLSIDIPTWKKFC